LIISDALVSFSPHQAEHIPHFAKTGGSKSFGNLESKNPHRKLCFTTFTTVKKAPWTPIFEILFHYQVN